jgi:hypothetical protein
MDPLSPGVVAILFRAWGAVPPDDVPTDADDDAVFDLWVGGEAGSAHAWTHHRAFLEQTAAPWGWTPAYALRDGRRVHFG